MRVFSTPFCGRDGESLSIRARGRPARSGASVMNLVKPGFYVGAKLAQINWKSFQYGKAGPNAKMNPPRGHRHAHRDLEQVLSRSVDGWLRRSMADTGRFPSRHFIMQ